LFLDGLVITAALSSVAIFLLIITYFAVLK